MAIDIPFRRDLEVEYGVMETVSPLIRRIIARNPSPFTFLGTGTYVVGHGKVAVIDPGPALMPHIEALLGALAGETITHILVTHTHIDHSPAAAAVKEATGAPTYGFGPHGGGRVEENGGGAMEEGGDRDFVPDVRLGDGDVVEGPGWHISARHTPGHTSNHLCFALAEEKALFSGDHVMGWSTSVIVPPDGDMSAYMRSLRKLLDYEDDRYWPTHGAEIENPRALVRAFISHRRQRSEAILRRLTAGDRTIAEIVPNIYLKLDPRLRPAAARSVLAHLIELVEQGRVSAEGPPGLTTLYRLRNEWIAAR
ncbi:MAG TPA: MBL fold metallo-hydrolase [Stellaceae bacterium]|nr:MBL fold metallo-hydrolase [Stellaceae bacterium]